MKRVISVLAAMAIMAAMVAVMAAPAFSAASENANTVGERTSDQNQIGKEVFDAPGGGGKFTVSQAKNGGLGDFASNSQARGGR